MKYPIIFRIFNYGFKNKLFILTILFFIFELSHSHPIHYNYFTYKINQILYDTGERWDLLSTFGTSYDNTLHNKSKLKYQSEINILDLGGSVDSFNNSLFLNVNYLVSFKKYYYLYYYPKIQIISENGFKENELIYKNNETISGVGFKNKWLNVQLGKNSENWGSGDEIQLALSHRSDAYDYILISSDYGKIRVRYIHGFLENTKENINRYITARGFEWTNKKSLIVGFSETVIYSGKNRSIDLAYINPISTHLEIELNNRLNIIGNKGSNAVWQFHLDFQPIKKLRFSLNYLYDEFVLDPEKQLNKEHGKAFSSRIVYSIKIKGKKFLNIYASFISVGTPTFRHSSGLNNFTTTNRPLGWYRGSDGRETNLGMNYSNIDNFICTGSIGLYQIGEESISHRVFDPYKDYQKGSFPSGNFKESFFFNGSIMFFLKNKITLGGYSHISVNNSSLKFTLTYNFFR